ncbi:unnamed protein product [Eruca vesicaria subsp. sativa]|uniref:Jacalin-type lectin domain-containing protein n=1 Tax=Eruca vesicaria subsp. sativa TaxID=29727 RepID=A0ABC8KEA4_ERUVS|nr:unnamed protein product [Eruca vesicaria subsp. sativa]
MEMIKMGPIGSRDHILKTEWDEMGHNIISHIIISYDKSGVRSIQFGYVDNGALVMSKIYGASPLGYSSRIETRSGSLDIRFKIFSTSEDGVTFRDT